MERILYSEGGRAWTHYFSFAGGNTMIYGTATPWFREFWNFECSRKIKQFSDHYSYFSSANLGYRNTHFITIIFFFIFCGHSRIRRTEFALVTTVIRSVPIKMASMRWSRPESQDKSICFIVHWSGAAKFWTYLLRGCPPILAWWRWMHKWPAVTLRLLRTPLRMGALSRPPAGPYLSSHVATHTLYNVLNRYGKLTSFPPRFAQEPGHSCFLGR